MAIGSAIAIYFVVWWIALFVVLPFARAPNGGSVVAGADAGAPVGFRVLFTIIWTSVVAGVVLALLLGVRAAGIGLDDLPF